MVPDIGAESLAAIIEWLLRQGHGSATWNVQNTTYLEAYPVALNLLAVASGLSCPEETLALCNAIFSRDPRQKREHETRRDNKAPHTHTHTHTARHSTARLEDESNERNGGDGWTTRREVGLHSAAPNTQIAQVPSGWEPNWRTALPPGHSKMFRVTGRLDRATWIGPAMKGQPSSALDPRSSGVTRVAGKARRAGRAGMAGMAGARVARCSGP